MDSNIVRYGRLQSKANSGGSLDNINDTTFNTYSGQVLPSTLTHLQLKKKKVCCCGVLLVTAIICLIIVIIVMCVLYGNQATGMKCGFM